MNFLRIALTAWLVQLTVASAAVDPKFEKYITDLLSPSQTCAVVNDKNYCWMQPSVCATSRCEDTITNYVYINSRDANGRTCSSAGSDREDCNRQEREALDFYRTKLKAINQQKHEEGRREAAKERQREQQEWDQAHPTGPVVARAVMPFVPGAMVCPDLQTVDLMSNWMQQNSTEALEDKLFKGQASMMRRPLPPVATYLTKSGCVLVPSGEPLTVLSWNGPYPVIEVPLSNNRKVRGTTYPNMFVRAPATTK